MSRVKVPVLMFHSVADHYDLNKHQSFLSIPVRHFEKCLEYLAKNSFSTITLRELYNYKKYNCFLAQKPIVLTFDDGFLDNWVNAYPLLKKYGLKGTIFVNPEFVDPYDGCRPTLDDVWAGRIRNDELKCWGYLSWSEMLRMDQGGVMDIQSHTMSHTCYFKSNKIIDFHHHQDRYYWLEWNRNPEAKYLWINNCGRNSIEYGTPIYEYGESIITKRYFDDKKLRTILVQHVKNEGTFRFFKKNNWRDELYSLVSAYIKNHSLNDRYESDQVYEERVKKEIFESKRIIEEKLEKDVFFLCWPRGKFNETANKLAKAAGYLATNRGTEFNVYGNEPDRIHRIGGFLAKSNFGKVATVRINLFYFISQINSYRGKRQYIYLIKITKYVVRILKKLDVKKLLFASK